MNEIAMSMCTADEVLAIDNHFNATTADLFVGDWDGVELYISRKKYLEWLSKQPMHIQPVRREKGALPVNNPKKAPVGKQGTLDTTKAPPKCNVHEVPMRYDSQNDRFVCPDPHCDVVATRKRPKAKDLADSFVTGECELVKTMDDRYFLRYTQLDVFVEITDVIEPNGLGELDDGNGAWICALKFPNGIREVEVTTK